MAVVVMGREMLVTAIRSFIEQQGGDFSAQMAGKLKMVFQCVAVVASLVALRHYQAGRHRRAAALPVWLFWTLHVSVWLAVISTVYSGLEYVVAAARILWQARTLTCRSLRRRRLGLVMLTVSSAVRLVLADRGRSSRGDLRLDPRHCRRRPADVLADAGRTAALPLVAWSPRRPVPWALFDLVGIALCIWLLACSRLWLMLRRRLDWPPARRLDKLTLARSSRLLIVATSAVSLGDPGRRSAADCAAQRALRCAISACRCATLWRDLRLGLIGFVMLAPPVYALQGVLVYFWKPSKHPLMEMFKETPDAGFFVVLFVAAAVVAPLFEELLFRVLLQGFLEKAVRFRGDRCTSCSGRPRRPCRVPWRVDAGRSSTPCRRSLASRSLAELESVCSPPDSRRVEAERLPIADASSPNCAGLLAWLPIAISSLIFALLHYSHGPDWVPLLLSGRRHGLSLSADAPPVPSLVVHVVLNSLSMWGLWVQVYEGLGARSGA